jgi:hypothetical protein
MRKGLGIGTGGLVPEDNTVKVMKFLGTGNPFPECPKTRSVVIDSEGLNVGPIRTTPVPKMLVFTHVGSHDKKVPVDERTLFCFNRFHGYTPFLGLEYQLASWFQIEKEYSLLIWA